MSDILNTALGYNWRVCKYSNQMLVRRESIFCIIIV